jgi:hypothetical protein
MTLTSPPQGQARLTAGNKTIARGLAVDAVIDSCILDTHMCLAILKSFPGNNVLDITIILQPNVVPDVTEHEGDNGKWATQLSTAEKLVRFGQHMWQECSTN